MITLTDCDTIKIRFPDVYNIDNERIRAIRTMNPSFNFEIELNNQLIIEAKEFSLLDCDYHEIHLEKFDEKLFDELLELNPESEVNFEFSTNIIHIRMSTFGLISAITGMIIGGLIAWINFTNAGRLYTEDGQYKLEDPENPDESIRVNPDLSYISYDKVPVEEQKKWKKSFITSPPTLAIEIVSAKRSLKATLKKMNVIWMKAGTNIGIVICPFSKKYFIFESGSNEFIEKSIYEPFTHPLLPGYTGDFSKYVDEID
jgi:Uma2 family endonuclease